MLRCPEIRASRPLGPVPSSTPNPRNGPGFRPLLAIVLGTALTLTAAEPSKPRQVALLFDSMNSPFWQESIVEMRSEAARRGIGVLEAISNLDDNKQYQQVQSMIQRGVDGIIIIATDDKAVIPAIRAANAAGVAMIHFNRPPSESDAFSVAVVADNRRIMHDTVSAVLSEVRDRGGRCKAAVLLGDLGDANAVQRRDGFYDALAESGGRVEVVARIATEWNADKAFAGLANALQAHPDINLVVSSSDFLAPQIEQALRLAGKWKKSGEPGHVLVASFDGDANGYAQVAAGYFDADGVQNVGYEVKLAFDAMESIWNGDRPNRKLVDPGLVITRSNLGARRDQVWGYLVTTRKAHNDSDERAVVTVGDRRGWGERTSAFLRAFCSVETARDILLTMLPLAILVAGQMLVLLLGQIDLSMTAVLALGSVLAASVMTRHSAGLGDTQATMEGIAVCLAAGIGVGLFNGLCTAVLRMPSFVITLAMMMAGSGAAVWFVSANSNSISVGNLPPLFRTIGYGTIGGFPIALFVCLSVLASVGYVLRRTLSGRWIYAIGHNAIAARIAGVPVARVTVAAFTASGLCASVASVILTSRLETGTPVLGQNMLLDVIGAAVIGGISLFGGRGRLRMALVGVLFLCLLDKVLQLLGLSLFLVLAIKGLAILGAATADVVRQRRSTG